MFEINLEKMDFIPIGMVVNEEELELDLGVGLESFFLLLLGSPFKSRLVWGLVELLYKILTWKRKLFLRLCSVPESIKERKY